jgi:hypothetical protein
MMRTAWLLLRVSAVACTVGSVAFCAGVTASAAGKPTPADAMKLKYVVSDEVITPDEQLLVAALGPAADHIVVVFTNDVRKVTHKFGLTLNGSGRAFTDPHLVTNKTPVIVVSDELLADPGRSAIWLMNWVTCFFRLGTM